MGYTPIANAAASCALSKPIVVMGEPVTELHFRDLELGDIEWLELREDPKFSVSQVLDLAARLSGISRASVATIKACDLAEVAAVVLGFFGDGPATVGG